MCIAERDFTERMVVLIGCQLIGQLTVVFVRGQLIGQSTVMFIGSHLTGHSVHFWHMSGTVGFVL